MSRRLKITLPDPVCAQLEGIAADTGEPVSRLAAQLVLRGVAYCPGDSQQTKPPSSGLQDRRRPRWLAPRGEDGGWRFEMWNAITALYNRYTLELSDLNDHWWESEALVETLCALVTWRRRIDESARDPQEELAFQASLADCARILRAEAASATRAWSPGPPPASWQADTAAREIRTQYTPKFAARRAAEESAVPFAPAMLPMRVALVI
jgi:hypothetical protein